MKNTNQQPEGGTDLEGLQDFLIDVNLTDYDAPKEHDIEINLGDVEPEKEDKPEVEVPEAETKEEVKTEVTEPEKEEVVEEEVKTDQKDNYYAKLASKFLEKGKWQDAELELQDGSIVKLSELEDLNEDLFFQIEESQSKFNEEDIKTNYINKKDFDETKLKIINILKEGGDIKDIFATPEESRKPFEGADIEDDQVQKSIFFNYLTKVTNLNAEDATVILNNHEKRGELGPKVKEIVQEYQNTYDNNLNQKLEQLKLQKAEQVKKDKEFSKNLEEVYKQYNLDPKLTKKFSTLGTKRNETGDFELDTIYSEKLEKPEEAAELIFFLTDKEGYLKSKMIDTKISTQKENLRRINLIKDRQKKDDRSTADLSTQDNPFVIKID